MLGILCLTGCEKQAATTNDAQVIETQNPELVGESAVGWEQIQQIPIEEYTDWDDDNATRIQLTGEDVKIRGGGCTVKKDIVHIKKAGTYIVEGTWEDGSIWIEARKEDTVRLVLNGVNMKNSDGPAILSRTAAATIISLAPEKENTIADGRKHTDTGKAKANGVLTVKGSLTINGTGTLHLTGNYKNGISCSGNLSILDSTLTVDARKTAVQSRDVCSVRGGRLDLESGSMGIRTTGEQGILAVEGGVIQIESEKNGIDLSSGLLVKSSSFSIKSGGGSVQDPFGKEMQAARGIEAADRIDIEQGTFQIDSSDTGIFGGEAMVIHTGNIVLSSRQNGIRTEDGIRIEDGIVKIQDSFNGIEAGGLQMEEGDLFITARNSGMVCGGGVTIHTSSRNAGEKQEDGGIVINGGAVTILAEMSGLDINGSLFLKEGILTIYCPDYVEDSIINLSGSCSITGGTLMASGGGGQTNLSGGSSQQPILMVRLKEVQKSQTLLTILNEKGENVFACAPVKDYKTVVICSAALEQEKQYELYLGGAIAEVAENGIAAGNLLEVGNLTESFKIEGLVTYAGDFPGQNEQK